MERGINEIRSKVPGKEDKYSNVFCCFLFSFLKPLYLVELCFQIAENPTQIGFCTKKKKKHWWRGWLERGYLQVHITEKPRGPASFRGSYTVSWEVSFSPSHNFCHVGSTLVFPVAILGSSRFSPHADNRAAAIQQLIFSSSSSMGKHKVSFGQLLPKSWDSLWLEQLRPCAHPWANQWGYEKAVLWLARPWPIVWKWMGDENSRDLGVFL